MWTNKWYVGSQTSAQSGAFSAQVLKAFPTMLTPRANPLIEVANDGNTRSARAIFLSSRTTPTNLFKFGWADMWRCFTERWGVINVETAIRYTAPTRHTYHNDGHDKCNVDKE